MWMLNRLNNIDKHRVLIVVAVVFNLSGGRVSRSVPEGAKSPDFKVDRGPVYNGREVASFDFHGSEPPPDFKANLGLQVIVDEPALPWIRHQHIVEVLVGLHSHVRWTIFERWFKPFFTGRLPY
jgi:hypothetical protein